MKSSKMYGQFQTDEKLEVEGIYLRYDGFQLKVRRAGGANKAYEKALERLMRPHMRAFRRGTLSKEISLQIMQDAFVDSVLIGWEVWVEKDSKKGEWKSGIEDESGKILPFTRENVMMTFKKLPDLWNDVNEQVSRVDLFREEEIEEISGN